MPFARSIAPTVVDEPVVASSLVSAIRRLLIEQGRWDDVRVRLCAIDARAAEWIDAPLGGPWYPLERHLALMAALSDLFGEDGLRELGRQRMQETMHGGVLAPLFRSWVRSFRGAPRPFLRVVPHAWSAATRRVGRLAIVHAAEHEVRMRLLDAPEAVRRAWAWHRFLEGYCNALLEAGGLSGRTTIVPCADGLDVVFRCLPRA